MHSLRRTSLGKPTWGKKACAWLLLCATTPFALQAQTLTTLLSFNYTDGAVPYGVLVQGTDGNLYGTATDGGTGYGTVFKITPSGTLTMLYSFCSQTGCTDGEIPEAGLVQASNGNFYGTTYEGGANGSGTIFEITPGGKLTTLHSFCTLTGCTDGSYPHATLIQAADGNFYGSTFLGGNGYGTIFKMTPSGTFTTLYTFCSLTNCTDGEYSYGALLQVANGTFYGTTVHGGLYGAGTVFTLTPSGTLTTLYNFCPQTNCADGNEPLSALVQGPNGTLYGTTYEGGVSNDGTVFSIAPTGAETFTSLHSFDRTDGANPFSSLVQATDGNFYGTTFSNATGVGTVFKITQIGTLTTVYSFCLKSGCPDGANPYGGLLQHTNGKLYGTTTAGGTTHDGTAFSLSLGLHPFVETQTASGKVGAAVKILGTKLTGATSVTFNSTVAVFKVVSSSLITATVPTGATTGFVTVTTPSGTLKSNKTFIVMP